ncbi:MAG: UbiA family prenyltransferase [Candidatus Micrarchaeota archaeon]
MIKAWWKLFRAEHALMVFAAIVLTQVLVAKTLAIDFVLAALGPAFVTLAAFSFNDYAGFKSDSALKRIERPIVAGLIKRSTALYASLFLFTAGCALAFLFAPFYGFLITLAFAFLSIAYDVFLKKMPLVGNLYIATAMSASYYYGNIVVSPELNYFVLVFIGMSFFSGVGRELIITLRDVEGDKKAGAVTLPMVIGARKTVFLAAVFIYLAVVASVLPLLKSFYLPYLLLVGASDALWLGSTTLLFLKTTDRVLKKVRDYSLCALILGLVAYASLVFA